MPGQVPESSPFCLFDIKAWIALNFRSFNNNKAEVMLFGFIWETQGYTSAVEKSSFFQLRQLANVKPLLSRQYFEKVFHAFITCHLDFCNSLYEKPSFSVETVRQTHTHRPSDTLFIHIKGNSGVQQHFRTHLN